LLGYSFAIKSTYFTLRGLGCRDGKHCSGASQDKYELPDPIVYYVFFRLFEEAKTVKGRELAKEKWEWHGRL
jgi:hypothetical protein